MKRAYYENVQDMQTENLISSIGQTTYPSHFHHKVEMTYMKVGFTHSVINGKKYFADTDMILFVPEYYPHSYATSLDAKRMVLLPSANVKSDYDKLTDKTFPCVLDDTEFNRTEILPLLENLYEIRFSDVEKNAKFLLFKAYVELVFAKLFFRYGSVMVKKDQKNEMLANVLDYIERSYDEKITLPEISKRFGYNEFHFSKLFNGATGESLTNYVNTVRVRKFVEAYSSAPNSTVLSVAFSVGFESMPSFYRAFKRVYGVTPVEYFATDGFLPSSR